MRSLTALTREVSPSFASCELTHLARVPIDVALARAQHAQYERCLSELGCRIVHAEPAPDLPDSVFVEDIAIVFDEVAVLTRPGAESRRAETPGLAAALENYRPLRCIQAPATIDGGDVLVIGRSVFIGSSTRTNAAAIDQMREILRPFGYTVSGVEVSGCLHLKSAVTAIDDERLLVNRAWISADAFAAYELVDVDGHEPYGANVVRVNEALLYPDAFPRTRARLEGRGYWVVTVDVREIAKAEGGVTCCSLLWRNANAISPA